MARRGGGKLVKTEAVQVRFDPILKLAAELAASKERRTLSSFTEMAIDRLVNAVQVARDDAGQPLNAYQVAQECWHSDPRIRLQTIAARYPDLLTLRERKIVQAWRYLEAVAPDYGSTDLLAKDLLILRCWDLFGRYGDEQLTWEAVIGQLRDILKRGDWKPA